MTFSLEYYLAAARDTMSRASRTIETGTIDTSFSGSKDKPKGIIEDARVMRAVAGNNIDIAVERLYGTKEVRLTKVRFRELFEETARLVRSKTITLDAPLYRTHEIESKKSYYGCPVAQIATAMDAVYEWGQELLNRPLDRAEVPRYGAQFEKIIDTDIHPLADACGRVGKLMHLFLAMRNDAPSKVFPDRQTYYRAMGLKRQIEKVFDESTAKEVIALYCSQPDFVM